MKIRSHRCRPKPAADRGLSETVRARIAPILRDPARFGLTRCTVCLGPADATGVFFPNESFARRIGQPEGKRRILLYSLCDSCAEEPGWQARLEAIFLEGRSSSKENPSWPV
jgi:hypothetical protein